MIRSRARFLLACGFVLATNALWAQFGLFEPSVPHIVFFPPAPPIYGAPIESRPVNGARWLNGRRLSAPDGMAEFVCEDFYPALSTRLFIPELDKKLEARIRLYSEKRQSQVQALLNEFVVLHAATADERERQLRAFAETQTPQLVALEAEAERLRADIINDGIFTDVDWNAYRRWKLGAIKSNGDWTEAEAEFQVVRAAAFYQKGLVSAQRGLVRELAMELQNVARKARGLPGARSESDAMFFSPETTRFRLPPNLSAATKEKIGAYNGQKAALKRELRETIVAQERNSTGKRAEAFEALAEKQWPELKLLEALADEIRGLLVHQMKVAPPPAPPWIPAGLLESIHSYNKDRDDYFAELKQRIDYLVAAIPVPNAYAPKDERVQEQREYADRKAKVTKQATMDFQEKTKERFGRLEQRYEAIRQMLTVVAEKQTDPKTGRPLTAATILRQHALAMEEFATFGREETIYTNYRIAMFQPGLSPEQRRLLLGHALIGLAQPLPGGDIVPRRSNTRPYPSS